MKSIDNFIVRLFADAEPETNDRGNEVRRAFLSCDRYRIDFAEDFSAEKWEQFDTDQDANYFGVWVNKRPERLQTLTYAEGDWILVSCPDAAHFNAEVENMIAFYGEGYVAKVIHENGAKTTFRQAREQFLIS